MKTDITSSRFVLTGTNLTKIKPKTDSRVLIFYSIFDCFFYYDAARDINIAVKIRNVIR